MSVCNFCGQFNFEPYGDVNEVLRNKLDDYANQLHLQEGKYKELEEKHEAYKKIVEAAKIFAHGDQENADEHFDLLDKALTLLWRKENGVKRMTEKEVDDWLYDHSGLMDDLASKEDKDE